MRAQAPDDALLCECEMVSQRAIQSIAATSAPRDATASSPTSPCAAASARAPAKAPFAPYDHRVPLRAGSAQRRRGAPRAAEFFRERWRGQHPVLWGEQLAQVELGEAIHCGLHGYELIAQAAARPWRTYDVAVVGAGLAGMSAAVFAATRGLRARRWATRGRSCSRAACSTVAVHPVEEGRAWSNPWAGLAALGRDLPQHPYARLEAARLRAAASSSCHCPR